MSLAVWDGTAFGPSPDPVRVWDGTAWVDAASVAVWDGSAFVALSGGPPVAHGQGTTSITFTASATGSVSGGGSAVLDDFNRADGPPGSNWTYPTGEYVIESNHLTRPSTTPPVFAYAMWTPALGSDDHYVEADVGNSPNQYLDLVVRGADVNNSAGYEAQLTPARDGSPTAVLVKNPGFVSLGSVGIPSPVSHMRLEVQGSSLRLFIDSALTLSITDTAIPTGRHVGVACTNDHIVDSSYPRATFDNFNAGPL